MCVQSEYCASENLQSNEMKKEKQMSCMWWNKEEEEEESVHSSIWTTGVKMCCVMMMMMIIGEMKGIGRVCRDQLSHGSIEPWMFQDLMDIQSILHVTIKHLSNQIQGA